MTVKTLENGFKIYIEEKPGFIEKQAMLAVRFGSDVSSFSTGNGEIMLPHGTAHFIEHKMFDSENGNYMTKFAENAAEVNAFTSFDVTAYYFSCRDNFYTNLSLLLEMFSEPYFTEDGIKSERSIIEKEINMYRDDIRWKCFFSLLAQMYSNMPVSSFIAGTEEEIAKLSPEIMYSCYENFYTPQNTALIVVGDVDEDKIVEAVCEKLKLPCNKEIVINEPKEKEDNVKEIYIDADIKLPLFYFGLKYPDEEITAESIVKRKIFLELLAGDHSRLYNNLSVKHLTEEPISYEYLKGRYYNASFISGTSDKPEAVKEELTKCLENIDKADISLAAKKLKGKLVMQRDDITAFCAAAADCFAKNIDYLDIWNLYDKMEKEKNFYFDGPESIFMSVTGRKR